MLALILGSLAEWSMALVLKTSEPKGSESSNLSASAKNTSYYKALSIRKETCGFIHEKCFIIHFSGLGIPG